MVKEIYDLTHILSWWCKWISALLEHKHLESMTWHISCHGVIKGSITVLVHQLDWHCSYEVYDLTQRLSWCDMGFIIVLVHQLAGTAHMRSMT